MKQPWYRRFLRASLSFDSENLQAQADESGAEAQNNLGAWRANRKGLAQDFPAAAESFRKAAEDGHAMAQNNLAMMYAAGEGMPRDDVEAAKWFRKAADQGDAGAQFNLGTKCHRASLDFSEEQSGESRIQAYVWFHLAAAQGYRNAESSCGRINLQMTRAEVAEGNRRAAAFVPRKESRPGCG